MEKDNTEPFNPNNPKHLKGFEKWVKKEAKRKPEIEGVLIPKKIYNFLKSRSNGFDLNK